MILKIILLLILCFLVIFVAYKIYRFYIIRLKFFEDLCDFCSYMTSQISFLKTDLLNIVEKQKSKYSIDFNNLLFDYQKIITEKQSDINSLQKRLDKITFLKQDEKEKINSFFDNLGKSNIIDQVNQITQFKNEINKIVDCSKEDNKKYGTSSIKFGILLAFALFIIFI